MQNNYVKKLRLNKKTIIRLNQPSMNRMGGLNTPHVTTFEPSARYSCGDPRCNGATTSKPSLETIGNTF